MSKTISKLEDFNIPNNYEAEKTLISQLLIDNKSFYDFIDIWLTHRDFYNFDFSKLFQVIVWLMKEWKEANLVTVWQYVDIDYDIVWYALSTSGIKDNAIIIKELSVKRDLIKQSNKICNISSDKNIWLDILRKEINKMVNISCLEPEHKSFSDELDSIYEELYTDWSDRVLTNYRIVDKLISFKKKQLVTIAGRPWTGKSSIMWCFSLSMHNVAFFSLEMSKQEISLRFASNISWIPFWQIDSWLANKDDEFRNKVKSAFDKIKSKNISVYDNITSLNSIVLEIKKLKIVKDIDVVFIDYLQLIWWVDTKLPRALQIWVITRQLKQLAKELDILIIMWSQLNRDILKRTNKTPLLSDLRESWDIEQDSDIVLFIDDDEDLPWMKELIVWKYRNWQKTRFQMEFSDNTMTLVDKLFFINESWDWEDSDSIF